MTVTPTATASSPPRRPRSADCTARPATGPPAATEQVRERGLLAGRALAFEEGRMERTGVDDTGLDERTGVDEP